VQVEAAADDAVDALDAGLPKDVDQLLSQVGRSLRLSFRVPEVRHGQLRVAGSQWHLR
jgi:hypothetical protein